MLWFSDVWCIWVSGVCLDLECEGREAWLCGNEVGASSCGKVFLLAF